MKRIWDMICIAAWCTLFTVIGIALLTFCFWLDKVRFIY